MKITLTDGQREFSDGLTALEIAGQLSQQLKKEAVAAKIDGKIADLTQPINGDHELEILTFADEGGKRAMRHTASHVLAQAVKNIYPSAKLAIGPAIENGFYYDFDIDTPFTPEDIVKIEKEMNRIVKRNLKLERFVLPRDEAISLMKEKNESYKIELIEELPEDEEISFYKQGDFIDLCAGPHAPSTGYVKAFKVQSVAGAYWRGDERNKMLQRIYATAFWNKEELEQYLARIEEAKKRDHRKLARELDLFATMEEGPGFPFFFPKGMIIYNALIDYWRKLHRIHGYQEIKTPIILSKNLWERSGHWDHYRENMYTTKIDDADFCIKPMNCPGGMLVYKRRMWSYRDLPLRLGELGLVHRHELSGALHGLMRVRSFTQDDAHIFMTREQISAEITGVYDMVAELYAKFGLNFHVELSTQPENSMGDQELWDEATQELRAVLDDKGAKYIVNEGDGAFYGPKIDFHIEDSLGRTWQCATIQLDFQMPELFDLTYTGADGEKHRPVMLHRVLYGAVERFIAILIEHFAGALPLWLSPVQAKILTITERADDFARKLSAELEEEGIRTEIDLRNEKIGFKIREAGMEKVPYMLVIGDKEVESGSVAVRARGNLNLGVMAQDEIIARIKKQIKTMQLNLD